MRESSQLAELDRGQQLQQAHLAVSRALLDPSHADPADALAFSLGTVADALRTDAIALVAVDEEAVSVRALWSRRTGRATMPGGRVPRSDLPDIGALTPAPNVTKIGVDQLPPALVALLRSHGYDGPGIVAFPLIAVTAGGSEVLGALAVRAGDATDMTDDEVRIIESIGGCIWSFLGRQRTEATLARRAVEAELLAGFGAMIADTGPTINIQVVTEILHSLADHLGGASMGAFERLDRVARPFAVWDPESRTSFRPLELGHDGWERLRLASPHPCYDGDWTIYPAVAGDEILGMLAVFREGGVPVVHERVIAETIQLLSQLRLRAVAERQLRRQRELEDLRSGIATSYVEADHWQVMDTTVAALEAVGTAFHADGVMWLTCAESRGVVVDRVWRNEAAQPVDLELENAEQLRLIEAIAPYTIEPVPPGTEAPHRIVVVPAHSSGMTKGALALVVPTRRSVGSGDLAVLSDIAQLVQTMEAWASVEAETDIRRERLQFQATHDDLTGLGNRRLLLEALAKALKEGSAAVLMIDLDRFKVVNDSLGHNAGDAVLTAIADRLRLSVRDRDLTCRFGGDEFAVMVPGAGDEAALAALAHRLIEIIHDPVTVQGTTIIPTCSIGIAVTTDEDDLESALRHADAALYEAKRLGRDRFEFFNEDRRESLKGRLALETSLRQGLQAGQFVPWFQPEVDLLSRSIIGVEALIRWNHPVDGMLAAAAFIDVAEEVGLAPELSRISLEASCAALAEWRTMGFDTRVRINVAAAQLQTGDLDVSVAAALDRYSIPADRLCVEITERSLMLDIDASAAALRQLRRMGVEVAIDDFGTGFSSLAWLQGLPVDTLKIDRSFVAGLTGGRTDRNIVSTIINLAEAVGLEVVAEGVETERQALMLTDLGCHRAQGWLWWGALPADEIPRLLRENSLSPVARPDDPSPLPHPGVDR